MEFKVIALVGSSKFKDEFLDLQKVLTLAGNVVLSLPFFKHADGLVLDDKQTELLSALYFQKIEMADEIMVVNPGGYIGDHTRMEIAFATQLKKPIRYYEDEKSRCNNNG